MNNKVWLAAIAIVFVVAALAVYLLLFQGGSNQDVPIGPESQNDTKPITNSLFSD